MISLTKDEKISLTKKDSTIWNFGSNWAKIERKVKKEKGFFGSLFGSSDDEFEIEKIAVDLDSYACMSRRDSPEVDVIYFGNYRDYSLDKSGISHSGDDRSGDDSYDDRDNETITLDLDKLKLKYSSVVLGIYSFRNQKFDEIPYMSINIRDNTDAIVGTFHIANTPSMKGRNHLITGVINLDTMEFKAIGVTSNVKSFSDANIEAIKYCS